MSLLGSGSVEKVTAVQIIYLTRLVYIMIDRVLVAFSSDSVTAYTWKIFINNLNSLSYAFCYL